MSINSFEQYFLSWVPDRGKMTRPCYLSLANQLEQDIRSGKLAPGTQLPPQREIADFLGLNFTTVTRAYDLCKERGLIYGVTGRGSFVSPLPGVRNQQKFDRIELGLVNGFDHIRKQVIEATQNVLKKGYLDQLYSYSDPAGHLHQRAAGTRWMEQLGVKTDPAHTAVFSGAQNVISAALLSLFKLGDRIAVDPFTYSNLIGTARMMHIPLVPVEGDSGGMLPEALEKICSSGRISGIFLMPDCANPTTVTLTEERRDALARIIRKYDLILIEDDCSCNFRNRPAGSFCSRLPEQTVYICGSTKHLCSGLRVTFAAFPERFREPLLNGLHLLNIKTSSLDAEIMTELIMSGRAEQILKEKQILARRANEIFHAVFPEEYDPEKMDCFFRKLPLPATKLDGMQIEKLFSDAGVSVYHSNRFSVQQHSGNVFLRLSLSSTANETALSEGLNTVKQICSVYF